jgi:hypothetical protein
MNTKSPGRSNGPSNSNPASNGGANFAPMTFAGKQNHLSNSNVGGEQYNYSIPSDNNFYPMMHHNQMGGGNSSTFN